MNKPLFAEIIPVSQDEIEAWLNRMPNLSSLPSRRAAYAKAYDIAGKIRARKAAEISQPASPNREPR